MKLDLFDFSEDLFSILTLHTPPTLSTLRIQPPLAWTCLQSISLLLSLWLLYLPGEPKRGGHVTITHQILASITRVFCVFCLDLTKDGGKFGQDVFSSLSHFVTFYSHLFIQLLKQNTVFFRLTFWWGEMNLTGQFFSG